MSDSRTFHRFFPRCNPECDPESTAWPCPGGSGPVHPAVQRAEGRGRARDVVLQWRGDKIQLSLLGGGEESRDPQSKPKRHWTVLCAPDEPLQQCDHRPQRHCAV